MKEKTSSSYCNLKEIIKLILQCD